MLREILLPSSNQLGTVTCHFGCASSSKTRPRDRMLLQILFARSLFKPHYCWAIHGARALLLGSHRSVSLRASRWGTARAFASDTVFGSLQERRTLPDPSKFLPNSFQIDPDPPFLINFLFLVDLQKREGPMMPRQCLDLAGWRCQGLEAFSVCLGKDHEGRDHDLGPPGHQGGKPESQRSCRHNNQGPVGRWRCTLDLFIDFVWFCSLCAWSFLHKTFAYSCQLLLSPPVTIHHVAQMESNQVAAKRGN